MTKELALTPIKYQIEASLNRHQPWDGVTVKLNPRTKKWVLNIESDNQSPMATGLIVFTDMGGDSVKSFKTPELALEFWKKIREKIFKTYPYHGYNMGFYTQEERDKQHALNGDDPVGDIIAKLNKQDRKRRKKK
jgi:hypothetical protein